MVYCHRLDIGFVLQLCGSTVILSTEVSTSMKSCQAAHLHSCWGLIRLHREAKTRTVPVDLSPCALVSIGGKSSSFSCSTVFTPICIPTTQTTLTSRWIKALSTKREVRISFRHLILILVFSQMLVCTCQSMHTLSRHEGKLFCCRGDNNGGLPIGTRCVCVLQQCFTHSSVFQSVITISECSDIRQEGGIKCKTRQNMSPVNSS